MSGLEFMRAIQDGRLAPPPMASVFGFEMTNVEVGRVTFEWHASGAHLLERGTAATEQGDEGVAHRVNSNGTLTVLGKAGPIDVSTTPLTPFPFHWAATPCRVIASHRQAWPESRPCQC